MRSLRLIVPGFFLMTLLLTSAAFAQSVTYNFDSKVDFTQYKTYHWEKHPQSMDLDPLTVSQLGGALDTEFATKGFTKVDSNVSDFVVVYQLALKSEKELTTYSSGFSTGPYWGGYYGGGLGTSYSTTSVNTIQIGTLALDIYDPKTNQLIWRGIATKTLDTGAKPGKRQRNMAKAAEKLLKNFPPPVKKK